MAIQSFQLDPDAQAYTDDEIVGKVNTAAVNITRAGSVEATARPIAAGEVGATELENEAFLAAEKTKLGTVEDNAAADQTGAEIKTAYEGEANTYNDTKDTKLTGIEDGADVSPADLAALDSAAATKLSGVEDNAKDDQTGAEIRDAVVALAPTDRKIVVTNPGVGEHKVVAIQRLAIGDLDVDYDDQPEE